MNRFRLVLVLAITQFFVFASDSAVGQQSRFWTGAGNYLSPGNWSPSSIPAPFDSVFFTNGSNTAVIWDQNYSSGQFLVGANNDHSFYGNPFTEQNGQAHTHTALGTFIVSGNAELGLEFGGSRINFVANAGTTIDGGEVRIASTSSLTTLFLNLDNGVLNQTQGGNLTVNTNLVATNNSRINFLGGPTTTGLIDIDGGSIFRVENQLTTGSADFADSSVVVQGGSTWDSQNNSIDFNNSMVTVGGNATINAGDISGGNVRVVFGDTKVTSSGTITGGNWLLEASGEVEADRVQSGNFAIDGTDSKLTIHGDPAGPSARSRISKSRVVECWRRPVRILSKSLETQPLAARAQRFVLFNQALQPTITAQCL